MALIDIKKIKKTSDDSLPKGSNSWLEFWESVKGKKAQICEVKSCPFRAEVGGHVVKYGEEDIEYILPVCKSCNDNPDGNGLKAWESDLVQVK